MKGYFRKRGDKWSYTVDIGRDPATGKRKQKTKTGFKTKKEAQLEAAKLIAELEEGSYKEPEKQTLSSYLDEWLDLYARHRVKETTFKNYKRAIESRIKPIIGEVKLMDLNPTHGQLLVNTMIDEGLKPKYIEYVFTVLKTSIKQSIKWGKLKSNPFEFVEIPRARRVTHKTWNTEEVKRFLTFAKFDSPIYYTTLLTALHTGLRRGELLGLRWEDISFKDKKLSVVQALIYDEEGFRFSDPKTERSKRQVSIDDFLISELKKYKSQQNEFKLALGEGYTDIGLVFCRENGLPIYPRTLAQHCENIIKKANVPKIRLHDLRHTHATLLLKLGTNPKIVQERLGHTSIVTTMDTYSHVTPDMQEKAVEALEKELRG